MDTYIIATNGNIYYLQNEEVISIENYTGSVIEGFVRDQRFYMAEYLGGNDFQEVATPEDIFNILIDIEKTKYDKRSLDGAAFCNKNRALITIKLIYEEITQNDYSNITDALKEVRMHISFGDWLEGLSALEQAESLMPAGIYEDMHSSIVDYIENKFDQTILNIGAKNILNQLNKK